MGAGGFSPTAWETGWRWRSRWKIGEALGPGPGLRFCYSYILQEAVGNRREREKNSILTCAGAGQLATGQRSSPSLHRPTQFSGVPSSPNFHLYTPFLSTPSYRKIPKAETKQQEPGLTRSPTFIHRAKSRPPALGPSSTSGDSGR